MLSLKDQVESLFLPILGHKPSFARWKSSDSLFTFWIGVNDIGNSYWNQNFDVFHDKLMDEYFRIIEELYVSGARNFVLLNVPAIDRSPLTVGQGQQSVDLERLALASFNKKVEQRVKTLKGTHSDVWAQVFDSKKVFDKLLDKPQSYGLKNAATYCDLYQKYEPLPSVAPSPALADGISRQRHSCTRHLLPRVPCPRERILLAQLAAPNLRCTQGCCRGIGKDAVIAGWSFAR